jgi:hypothetical protein
LPPLLFLHGSVQDRVNFLKSYKNLQDFTVNVNVTVTVSVNVNVIVSVSVSVRLTAAQIAQKKTFVESRETKKRGAVFTTPLRYPT